MRVQLKVGENCSISKIGDTKLKIKLDIPLNNFNNSTYKDNTRIYIENINFPKIKDRDDVDVSQGVVEISTPSIEPDYNDFNSYQNINQPNNVFTAKIDDFQYNSSSPELYNFKINSSFINNCSFILDFKNTIGINTSFLRLTELQNEIASTGTTPSISIVSGQTDANRTITDVEFVLQNYEVSRDGNVLSQADYPYLYGINWNFEYDPTSDTIDDITFDAPTSTEQFPYKGLSYEIGDLITFKNTELGAGATDDVVIQVNNVQVSEIDQYRNNLKQEYLSLIEDRDKLLQFKQNVIEHNNDKISQLNLTSYFFKNTALPKYKNYLKKRLADNEALLSSSAGKLGTRRVLMIQNVISTIENGGQSNLFYLFLHTVSKLPFWQSTTSATVATIKHEIEDDDGNTFSLYSATELVVQVWNLYWTMWIELRQHIFNKHWFYGELPTFTKFADRFDGGSVFPTKSTTVWRTATSVYNFDTSSMTKGIKTTFEVVGDSAKTGDISYDYLMLRDFVSGVYNLYVAVSDFNRDFAGIDQSSKLLIPSMNGVAFHSIKTFTILATGETDAKRKEMTKRLFIATEEHTNSEGKQAQFGITVDSVGKATADFFSDAPIRGKDYKVSDFIEIPASFFDSIDEDDPAEKNLFLSITAVHSDTNGFELTMAETELLDTGIDKNIYHYNFTIEEKQTEEGILLRRSVGVEETAYWNYPIVDYILEYNLYNNASISLNIYNEDQEDNKLKPKKSIFKQNNYSTTPLCPSRRYIR